MKIDNVHRSVIYKIYKIVNMLNYQNFDVKSLL